MVDVCNAVYDMKSHFDNNYRISKIKTCLPGHIRLESKKDNGVPLMKE